MYKAMYISDWTDTMCCVLDRCKSTICLFVCLFVCLIMTPSELARHRQTA